MNSALKSEVFQPVSLNRNSIETIYLNLNKKLNELGLYEDLYVFGGAVMCDLGCRNSTMDIDAYYRNTELINKLTHEIGVAGVINNDIEPFLSNEGSFTVHADLGNLKVYYATDEYLFALKCQSCRTDSNDIKDLIFLTKKLNIKSLEQADEIIGKYFNLATTDSLYRDILEDVWSGMAEYYLI